MRESHGNYNVKVSERGERDLLHSANWEQAHYLYREGRISAYELRAWKLAHWCAMRFEGDAGRAQDRFASKCGMDALWRRRDRARVLWARFCGREGPSAVCVRRETIDVIPRGRR